MRPVLSKWIGVGELCAKVAFVGGLVELDGLARGESQEEHVGSVHV